MKKLMFYFVAGTLVTATACSSSDTATTDSTAMETSETVRSGGVTTDETTGTGTETGTDIRTGTGTDVRTGTETGTGTDVRTGTGTGTDMRTGTGTGTGTGVGTGTGTHAGMDMGAMDMASLTNLDDATFIMTAASSNMFEIQLGKMVADKAADPKVKEFARMMVDQHTKANKELKTVASEMRVTLPTTLLPMHQSMIEKLSGKTGKELDEDYMDTMETAHKMDIAMFEAKSKNAQSPKVKSFASKTLPTLQSHHQKANSIEKTVD